MANIANIFDQLRRDEGEVLHVYLDSRGIRTAGVGHNLEAHGIDWPVGTPISKAQSDGWLQSDVTTTNINLKRAAPFTATFSEVRYGVLLNMGFNMGVPKLLTFHYMLAFMQALNWQGAAQEMANSLWAKQVGDRARRLELQIVNGVWV